MKIFSNLAISLDGKIAPQDRKHFYLGTPYDRKQMQVIRKKADAILVGASTLRAFRQPMLVEGATVQPLNVVLSARLSGLHPNDPFFQSKKIERMLIIGPEVSEEKVRPFLGSCEVHRAPSNRNIARLAVEILKRGGVRSLLVEGGGQIMWEFIEKKLIDTFYVTLTPWIVGGREAPTLVDGKGFSSKTIQGLKLKACKRVGQELYLTYQRASRKNQ
jgi:riboflavin-specific deaminase-like protein